MAATTKFTTHLISRITLVVLVAAVAQCVIPPPAAAEIYTFTDARGVVHYTNVLTDPRYKPMPGIVSFSRPRPRPSAPLARPYFFNKKNSYTSRSFDSHIQEAADRYDLDPLLIKAVIKQESNFNPYATSHKGALGLMQLMPDTAKDMNVYNVFDPRENIFGGARYLKRLYSQCKGDVELALASYNAGPERVIPFQSIPPIPETQSYVRSVIAYYNAYRR